MLNIIPVSMLTANSFRAPDTIICPICRELMVNETEKTQHLESAHAGWATLMMSAFLSKIPRANG
jgi:hypothetical protein